MAKLIGKIVLLFVAAVMIWVGYLWLTYIDEVISSGEAYGFAIGSAKEVVYENAPKNLSDLAASPNMFFTTLEVTDEVAPLVGSVAKSVLLIQTRFHPKGFEFFNNKNLWEIYFEGGYNDFISFKFCDEKLCEIRRHRQYFEFP